MPERDLNFPLRGVVLTQGGLRTNNEREQFKNERTHFRQLFGFSSGKRRLLSRRKLRNATDVIMSTHRALGVFVYSGHGTLERGQIKLKNYNNDPMLLKDVLATVYDRAGTVERPFVFILDCCLGEGSTPNEQLQSWLKKDLEKKIPYNCVLVFSTAAGTVSNTCEFARALRCRLADTTEQALSLSAFFAGMKVDGQEPWVATNPPGLADSIIPFVRQRDGRWYWRLQR
ncbi:hypothetical protein QOT17_002837 [Balamuthia mandrillaris]